MTGTCRIRFACDFETLSVNEWPLGRIFADLFIIPPKGPFFNYAFKNIAIKRFKYMVLFQRLSRACLKN